MTRSRYWLNLVVLHPGANFVHAPSDRSPNLTSFTHVLMQNEIPLAATLAYLRASGIARLTTVFNPSPMLAPSELREFPWDDLTWLIVNEGELESLLKAFCGTPQILESGSLRDRAEKELLQLRECESFRKSVSIICTLGAQGILFMDQTSGRPSTPEIGYLPAHKLVLALRDTTGAGDCFAGYFVAGMMARKEGERLESILHFCLAVCDPTSICEIS